MDPRYRPSHGGLESATPALYEALAPMLGRTDTPAELADLLPWSEGSRSTSMFHFGSWAAQKQFDREGARAIAFARAYQSGMVAEYGLGESLRHWDRGYEGMLDSVVDFFPIVRRGISP